MIRWSPCSQAGTEALMVIFIRIPVTRAIVDSADYSRRLGIVLSNSLNRENGAGPEMGGDLPSPGSWWPEAALTFFFLEVVTDRLP